MLVTMKDTAPGNKGGLDHKFFYLTIPMMGDKAQLPELLVECKWGVGGAREPREGKVLVSRVTVLEVLGAEAAGEAVREASTQAHAGICPQPVPHRHLLAAVCPAPCLTPSYGVPGWGRILRFHCPWRVTVSLNNSIHL